MAHVLGYSPCSDLAAACCHTCLWAPILFSSLTIGFWISLSSGTSAFSPRAWEEKVEQEVSTQYNSFFNVSIC